MPERVSVDPNNPDGVPLIRGTQVPVHEVLERVAAGQTIKQIAAELPELDLQDVEAALAYAVASVRRAGRPEALSVPAMSGTDRGDGATTLDLNRILIVDDQEINRLYMQTMFRDSEFVLSMAEDGKEGLQKARAELPFLILADVQMPLMDGFELCRRLKADDRTKSAAVIFVTAHHRSSKKVIEGLDIGADDYIFRPFERGELMSRVKAVARLKRAEEEARRQAQTVARRNKELELLNELALAVASSLDLEEIFTFSTQKLSQLLDREAIYLLCFEPEQEEMLINVASRTGERVSLSVDFRPDAELTEQFIRERIPPLVSHILKQSGHADLAGGSTDEVGVDAPLITCIPMISKDQAIGAIATIDLHKDGFTDAEWVLLNSAAGIISVAVENARLLQSVQQQVVDLILLNEIGHALTSTLDLEQILRRTTQMVQESLRADAASLWLLDEDGEELVLTASSSTDDQGVSSSHLPVPGSIAGHVIRTGEPYFSGIDSGESESDAGIVLSDQPSSGSTLCVPVRAKDQIVGVVQADHQHPRWFDQNDLRLLYSVASSVGIAVENARLFSEVQEFNRRLERKVAERTRELAAEKEKTEAILASMADGLLVLDAENCVTTSNAVAEQMLDFELNAVQGRSIDVQRLADPLWNCVHDMVAGDQFTNSALVDVPDATQLGGVRSIQARAARIRDDADQILGTVIALRDITAITEVERMKARFMSGVTHELKTPLSIIRLHANNLETYQSRLSPQRRGRLLAGIQAQVKLLEQLVEDILELSRLDAGEGASEREPVDLVELTDEMMSDLRPLADGKSVSLQWHRPAENLRVLADKNQMQRLVRNLVDNAIKYTPGGGSVTLKLTSPKDDTLIIQVVDTGIGISPEHQTRVFDRFYRADPSHTIPGTGLGLSIVKEIATIHGGNVRLKSAPGVGTIFTVTLPRFKSSENPLSD